MKSFSKNVKIASSRVSKKNLKFQKKIGKAQNCFKIEKKEIFKIWRKKSHFFSIKILGLVINLYSQFSRLKIKFSGCSGNTNTAVIGGVEVQFRLESLFFYFFITIFLSSKLINFNFFS